MGYKVAILMGSDSDLAMVQKGMDVLDEFGVAYEAHISSAHRTPKKTETFVRAARENGFGVIIAAAGMAAHLAGVCAAGTTLPVIGIPAAGGSLGGVDALLSTVQMPPGIPVATVGIGGSVNAALLAVEMLALSDDALRQKLEAYRTGMAETIEAKDAALQNKAPGRG